MRCFYYSFLHTINRIFIFSLLSFPSLGSLQESNIEKNDGLSLLSKIAPNVLQARGDYYYLGKRIYTDPLKIKTAWIYNKKTHIRHYYSQEQEVTEDTYQQAVKYYKEAARHNYPVSLWSLGECYELGRGVKRNYQKALTCYSYSAEQGYAPAQFSIGFMYQEGQGVSQDTQKAIHWYRLAAQAGDPQASFRLALYAIRNQFSLSSEKVLDLLLSSAHHGYAPAQNTLGLFYKDVKNYEQDVIRWFCLAANQGYKLAQINLGDMYLEGKGLLQDEDQALKWYQLAGLYNNIKERWHFLIENNILRFDDLNTLRWCLWLAYQGHILAQVELGYSYYEGRGIPVNFEKAFKWFHLAADQGDSFAQFNLGSIYHQAEGTEQNYQKAFAYYRKAAKQGESRAQFNLAGMYYIGQGTEQNVEKALKWCQRAAEQGDIKAQDNLNKINKEMFK